MLKIGQCLTKYGKNMVAYFTNHSLGGGLHAAATAA